MNESTDIKERATTSKPVHPKKTLVQRILKPKKVQELRALWKERGLKGFIKEKGWKIVAAVFLYYLIRDTLLYIVLPIMAARGLLAC